MPFFLFNHSYPINGRKVVRFIHSIDQPPHLNATCITEAVEFRLYPKCRNYAISFLYFIRQFQWVGWLCCLLQCLSILEKIFLVADIKKEHSSGQFVQASLNFTSQQPCSFHIQSILCSTGRCCNDHIDLMDPYV